MIDNLDDQMQIPQDTADKDNLNNSVTLPQQSQTKPNPTGFNTT